jgi:hypothetical protein
MAWTGNSCRANAQKEAAFHFIPNEENPSILFIVHW